MLLIGTKNNRGIFNNLLKDLIPDNIELYVEPFGGEFGLYEIMSIKPKISIYNDINFELYNKIIEKYKNNKAIYCYNVDYKKIIYDFDCEDVFFYLDPPYIENETYYSNHTFLKKENHIELANILYNIKGKFLLSYQDRQLIRELYKKFNFYKYSGYNFILKPEIAITNYL